VLLLCIIHGSGGQIEVAEEHQIVGACNADRLLAGAIAGSEQVCLLLAALRVDSSMPVRQPQDEGAAAATNESLAQQQAQFAYSQAWSFHSSRMDRTPQTVQNALIGDYGAR